MGHRSRLKLVQRHGRDRPLTEMVPERAVGSAGMVEQRRRGEDSRAQRHQQLVGDREVVALELREQPLRDRLRLLTPGSFGAFLGTCSRERNIALTMCSHNKDYVLADGPHI